MGLVFWNSIHLEVPSDSFCFLINSSWLLVFILFMICWKGIYFSYNLLHIGLIFSFHYWCSSCPSRVNWKLMKKEESRVYGKVEDQEWLTIDCQASAYVSWEVFLEISVNHLLASFLSRFANTYKCFSYIIFSQHLQTSDSFKKSHFQDLSLGTGYAALLAHAGWVLYGMELGSVTLKNKQSNTHYGSL